MNARRWKLVLCLVLLVILLMVIPYQAQRLTREQAARCEALGGTYHAGREGGICLKPDAVIRLLT